MKTLFSKLVRIKLTLYLLGQGYRETGRRDELSISWRPPDFRHQFEETPAWSSPEVTRRSTWLGGCDLDHRITTFGWPKPGSGAGCRLDQSVTVFEPQTASVLPGGAIYGDDLATSAASRLNRLAQPCQVLRVVDDWPIACLFYTQYLSSLLKDQPDRFDDLMDHFSVFNDPGAKKKDVDAQDETYNALTGLWLHRLSIVQGGALEYQENPTLCAPNTTFRKE
ncbi:hypothetical protein RRG08_025599 [Elysia crispata]|uniref:Uncharacterized protein n=1 Tax=Elysia crispata TaxID=231223 RepID=A0AAE0YEL6_9GAST|nr:hypothetical protein RRG08_025599 [Elysia crispata]